MATLYSTNPTTSPSATTCRSVDEVPFAPVCRIVIMVEAAVTEARAARTIEKAKEAEGRNRRRRR